MQGKGAKLTYNLIHSKVQKGCLTLRLPRQQGITPTKWWDSYGDKCPKPQKFAIQVLSLTCSSSGCEHN